MAYLFGITLGKHPILPAISPKKTWEGWIGAWVSTLALSYPLFQLWFDDHNRHALVLALFAATRSPFRGFLASTLKRAYGTVKRILEIGFCQLLKLLLLHFRSFYGSHTLESTDATMKHLKDRDKVDRC